MTTARSRRAGAGHEQHHSMRTGTQPLPPPPPLSTSRFALYFHPLLCRRNHPIGRSHRLAVFRGHSLCSRGCCRRHPLPTSSPPPPPAPAVMASDAKWDSSAPIQPSHRRGRYRQGTGDRRPPDWTAQKKRRNAMESSLSSAPMPGRSRKAHLERSRPPLQVCLPAAAVAPAAVALVVGHH